MGTPATWFGLKTTACCVCNTSIGMEAGLYDQRYEDHGWFYCPNGHKQHFTGETNDQRRIKQLEREIQFAKEQAESAKRQREWAESRTKGANIAAGKAKAAAKRLLKRVHCGVCPHCQRTFKQLAAHMKSKHPKV